MKTRRPEGAPRPKMAVQAGPGGLGQVWAQTLKNLRKTMCFVLTFKKPKENLYFWGWAGPGLGPALKKPKENQYLSLEHLKNLRKIDIWGAGLGQVWARPFKNLRKIWFLLSPLKKPKENLYFGIWVGPGPNTLYTQTSDQPPQRPLLVT